MLSLCSLDVFVRAPVVKWNNNEYFIDWTDDQLAPLEEDVRPSRTLDAAEASIISKTERLLNTKLAWAWVSETRAMMYDRTQYVR